MKLLLVHNFYRSEHVGGEDVVFRAERAALTAALGRGNVWQYSVSNDNLSSLKAAKNILGSQEHADNIYALVKSQGIDVVHVHNFFPQLTPSIFKAAKAAGAVTVQTLHNYRWWCIAGTLYRDGRECQDCLKHPSRWPAVAHRCYQNTYAHSALAAGAFRHYDRYHALDHVDAFFYLSKTQYQRLQTIGLPAHRCRYKPNAIFWPETPMPWYEKKDYLYVGRLEEAKGIRVLLDIWKTLPEHFVLRVIGKGLPLEHEYASSNIHFLGKVSPEGTRQWINKAQYLLQPSLLEETFGLTILEAMAHATPVIGLARGTRREFVRPGFNGFLAEPENLREKIIGADRYPDYRLLSKNARAFAEEWSPQNIVSLQLKQYESCIKTQKTSPVSL